MLPGGVLIRNSFNIIKAILHDEADGSYSIHIKKNDEVLPWKKFNCNMAISVEYDLEY